MAIASLVQLGVDMSGSKVHSSHCGHSSQVRMSTVNWDSGDNGLVNDNNSIVDVAGEHPDEKRELTMGDNREESFHCDEDLKTVYFCLKSSLPLFLS